KPVWKGHSSSPVFELYARKTPSDPPWKIKPPAVASTPLPNPARYGTSFCHTCLLVRESSAVTKPYSRVPTTETRPVGLNWRVDTPTVKNRYPDRGSYAPGAQSPEADGCAIFVSVQTGVNMHPRS